MANLLIISQLAYKPYYHTLFTIGFDVYLEILEANRTVILKQLKRDAPDYRLTNTCPACSYRLQDDPDQTFEVLVTMDGNNSLKRLRRDGGSLNTDGQSVRRELPDSRQVQSDYYLSREEVNRWSGNTADSEQDLTRSNVSLMSIQHHYMYR